MGLNNSLRNFGLAALVATSLYGCSPKTSPTSPDVNPPTQNQAPDTFITSYTVNGRQVTFNFYGTDSDGNVTKYKYTHDNITNWPETTQKTITLDNVVGGNHFFMVSAIDDKGLSDSDPAYKQFTVSNQPVDTQAPDTQITSGPTGTIPTNDVSLSWIGSDDVTPTSQINFQYYLEGRESTYSPWGTTTSKSYSDLPNGNYIFRVRSKDLTGKIDQTEAIRPFTVNVQNPDPEFLDVIASYPLSVSGGPGWKGIDVDDTHIWAIYNKTIEKRLKSNPSAVTYYSIPGEIDPGVWGFTDIQVVGTEIFVHGPPSPSFYVLDKNNPTSIKRAITVPITTNGLNMAWSIEYLNGKFYLVTSNSTNIHETDSNLNLIETHPTPDNDRYYYGELTHDGNSDFWAIGCDYSNTSRSILWKLDSNFMQTDSYYFEYDSTNTWEDNAGLIDWNNGSFWTAAVTNGVPTLYQHKGN